jgi:hypothetical protein
MRTLEGGAGVNLDRTFCTGIRCKKANTCDLWHKNLADQAEKRGINLEGRRISMANFADHDGHCQMFQPLEDEEWESCGDCSGDGVIGHDCGEDTCCCRFPDEDVKCPTCDGKGGWALKL